jgi:NADH:ubiquinone oxidoreductase subunit 6 (subunit J)
VVVAVVAVVCGAVVVPVALAVVALDEEGERVSLELRISVVAAVAVATTLLAATAALASSFFDTPTLTRSPSERDSPPARRPAGPTR